MIFKIYECDFGIKINGVSYTFDHVNSLAIEDPESTKLVRGSNATNKDGLIYKEGAKDAKKITVTIIGMSADLYSVLAQAYKDKTRLDVFMISRADGSTKIARRSILSTQPQQLTIDDSAESMNVALAFESFDLTEVHKS